MLAGVSALNNWAVRLGETGRRAGALAASEEAVQVYRRLVTGSPAAYEPGLASSFTTGRASLASPRLASPPPPPPTTTSEAPTPSVLAMALVLVPASRSFTAVAARSSFMTVRPAAERGSVRRACSRRKLERGLYLIGRCRIV